MFQTWHDILCALLLLASRECLAREHSQPYLAVTTTTGSSTLNTRTRSDSNSALSSYVLEQLDERAECRKPCGFYNQLCCNLNEACVTDVNTQAQCSPTALPSLATFTVIKRQQSRTVTVTRDPILTIIFPPDSTIRKTRVISQISTVVQTTVVEHNSTVVQNQTVIETRTQRIPVLPSTTQTSRVDATSTASATAAPAHHKLSIGEKAGIGTGVGVGALVFAGILFWLRKRHNRQRSERDAQDQRRDEGDNSFLMQETAHISHKPSQRLQNGQAAPFLQPRAPTPQYGVNPFAQRSADAGPPYDADAFFVSSVPAGAEERVRSRNSMNRNVDEPAGDGGDGQRSRRAMREEFRNSDGYIPGPQPSRPARNMPPGAVGGHGGFPPTFDRDRY